MKTKSIRKEQFDHNSDYQREWHLIDAQGKKLGRLASEAAKILRGKHKPTYTSHVDTGDYIVIINAEKIELSGNKWKNKIYYQHTGYPGGLKSSSAEDLLKKDPALLLYKAVKGMMPKNKLNRKSLLKIKIYSGEEHPHKAQNPKILNF